ncbi:MAG: phosphoribosyltransferase [Candidatus Bathyarchaeia archaeon]
MRFSDRVEAGKQLGTALKKYSGEDTIVLGIPRGGVVTGFYVAAELEAPLDVIVPKKLGAPMNPELAVGAVTEEGEAIIDENLVERLGITQSYIDEEAEGMKEEIQRRLEVYRSDRTYPTLTDRVVILVDDGIATGATMRAGIASVKSRSPRKLVVGVPVAPPTSVREIESQVDEVVALVTPTPFYAIGQFYERFPQNTDEQVIRLLEENRDRFGN